MDTFPYIDGYLGVERAASVIPAVTYPFSANPIPDIYARRSAWMYQVDPQLFMPRIAARTSYTNLLTRSNDFGNAVWTKFNCNIATAIASSPWDGQSTVDRISESPGNTSHGVNEAVSLTSGSTYTLNGLFLADARTWVRLHANDSGTGVADVYFDLVSGRIGTQSGAMLVSARMQKLPNMPTGWFQCSITFLATATGTGSVGPLLATGDGVATYSGSGAGPGLYCANIQLELASASGPLIITTSATRTVLSPDLDPADLFCYLVGESSLTIENSARALFSRQFARIPANQVFPGAKYITRPNLHGVKSGTAYGVSFDDDQKFSWIFTSRKTVSAVTNFPGGTITGAMPSSNITMTDSGAHSVSFPANGTDTAIQAAVSAALTSLSGIIVTAGTGYLTIQWTGSMSSIVPPSGVIVSSFASFYVNFNSTGTTTTPAALIVTATAHGGQVGDKVVLWNGDAIVAIGVVAEVATADQFSLISSSLPSSDVKVSHCGFSSDAASCVVNGTIMCSIRRTQKYFLPGVSTGITTFADIPVAASQMDPISWLAAIIAGSAWTVESVGELIPADGLGSILMQETLEVQMADAIDQVTP